SDLKSFQTNEKGEVVVDGFVPGDMINFQHAAYESLAISFDELRNLNFNVFLVQRIIPIKEVTVSANKWKENKTEIANQILTLSARDISNSSPPTSADLLAGSGEVFVQKSQLGGGSPMLRGFAANSVLLVVDGIRMNNAIYRSGNLQNVINVDPNALASAEVIFGPGSVIYGSDALGGVMNFSTIQPTLSSSKSPYLHGGAFTRFSTAANEQTYHVHAELGKQKFAWMSSFTWTGFDDLKTGSKRSSKFPDFGKRPFYVRRINGIDQLVENNDENLQVDSGFDLFNTVQKVRFRPADYLDLEYGFYFSTTTDIPRYDRLIQTNSDSSLRYADWFYGPQRWMMHRFGVNHYRKNKLFDQFKLNLAYQDYQESRNDRRVDFTDLRNQTEQVDIYSVNLDLEKKMGQNNLYYGLEWVINQVDSEAGLTDINTGEQSTTASRYPDGGSTYRSLAAYFNYKHFLSEALILTTGLRYSHVHLSALTSDDRAQFLDRSSITLNNGAATGALGLVWKWNDKNTISTMLSSGFRSPNVDDVGKVFEVDGDEIVIPNSALRPEYSYNSELAFQKKLTSKFTLDLVAYHSWLDNAIVRGTTTLNGTSEITIDGETFNLQSQQNIASARIYGAGAKLSYMISKFWAFKGSINIIDGKETVSNEPLRHTPPTFGRASCIFRKGRIRAEQFIEFSGAKKFEDLAPTEKTKTDIYTTDGSLAWHTFNIRASYQVNNIISIIGSVENIMDKHYRTYSSGISAPGRNIILSLSAQF
ncbi:MAG: TonB-dependent receptor, partial [Bacteroidota bacterium]